MPLATAETTYLEICCPSCAQHTPRTVAWLVLKDNMTCKGCSAFIDLRTAENRILIKEFAELCSRMDATFGRL